MAKDGTRRGGARPGAGRKKKVQPEEVRKIISENALTEEEKSKYPKFNPLLCDGSGIGCAEDVYYSISKFADDNGAIERLPKELIELFAVAYSRWVQTEGEITKNGFISAHPTTGADCKSPLVEIANTYSKQAQNYWYLIWGVIKDSVKPQGDVDDMESLMDGV